MTPIAFGHNVRPLQARGLVRLALGRDRRSREVSLTRKGRETPAKGWKLWRLAQSVFERELGPDTAATLRGLLHRISATSFADG